MQNAKDTFYQVLRARIAAANPQRTIDVRGVLRPGVLVEENELVSSVTPPDCFRLRWIDVVIDMDGTLPVASMTCEILYETAGTAGNGGMDRGRLLTTMDAELAAAVSAQPQNAAKDSYAASSGPQLLTTNIWWSAATLGATAIKADRIGRTATLTVMSCEEAGEL